jgi:hypothetical protein
MARKKGWVEIELALQPGKQPTSKESKLVKQDNEEE